MVSLLKHEHKRLDGAKLRCCVLPEFEKASAENRAEKGKNVVGKERQSTRTTLWPGEPTISSRSLSNVAGPCPVNTVHRLSES